MNNKRSTLKTPRKKAMSDSYRQAVEEFRQWSENISAREEDWKNGRLPREVFDV